MELLRRERTFLPVRFSRLNKYRLLFLPFSYINVVCSFLPFHDLLEPLAVFSRLAMPAHYALFSPDGQLFATAGQVGCVWALCDALFRHVHYYYKMFLLLNCSDY